MSVLAVSVGRAGVVAAVDGAPPVPVLLPPGPFVSGGVGSGERDTGSRVEGLGWEAADVWRGVLDAVSAAVRAATEPPTALALTVVAPTTAVWDADSLGAARPIAPAGYEVVLRRVHDSEPHVWALLTSGRYAVGDLPGYLVARMTRGVWQVAAEPVVVPAGLASDRVTDVRDILPGAADPWPGPGRVRTDPDAFAGLDLPVVALVGVTDD